MTRQVITLRHFRRWGYEFQINAWLEYASPDEGGAEGHYDVVKITHLTGWSPEEGDEIEDDLLKALNDSSVFATWLDGVFESIHYGWDRDDDDWQAQLDYEAAVEEAEERGGMK